MVRDYSALAAFVAERADMPFAWGSGANDCVSFAARAVRTQTGSDPIAGLAWSSEEEADAVLERLGGLATALDARLRRIAPAMAHRGDVAGVMRGNQLGLMIVEGVTLVGPGLLRQQRRAREDMVMAWSAR